MQIRDNDVCLGGACKVPEVYKPWQLNCPEGLTNLDWRGINFCHPCQATQAFNITTKVCQRCEPDQTCFLASSIQQTDLKPQLNKFNTTSNPSLFDEELIQKQIIQETHFLFATGLLALVLLLIFIGINFRCLERKLVRTIVSFDFTLVTGGDHQTIMGGIIFFIYVTVILFIVFTLLQEQILLNQQINSTQMASQSSDLMIANTLFILIKLSITQMPIDAVITARVDLCHPSLFGQRT